MKKITLSLIFLTILSPGFSQTPKSISLVECHRSAIENYPLKQKKALLQQSALVKQEKLDVERLPHISWNARASFQSETVEFPFEAPGFPGLDLPLFNVRTSLDATYSLYDAGLISAQKQLENATLLAAQQAVIVDLEQLKPKVNQYFFGIILLREKVEILANSLQNLDNKIEQLEAGVRHGIVLEGEVEKLQVQKLRLQAGIDEANGNIKASLAVLSELINEQLDESVQLELPDLYDFSINAKTLRQELRLFELEKNRIMAGENIISATQRPKVGAFLQVGLGYPNPLNFFDETFSPFALLGLNFSWKIFDWKQAGRDRQLLSIQSRLVDNQRAVFEKNINLLEGKFREDIATAETLITRDEEILGLQEKILLKVSSQLDNGVITSAEYLDQLNAAAQARLQLQTHRLQLKQIKINYLTHKGIL